MAEQREEGGENGERMRPMLGARKGIAQQPVVTHQCVHELVRRVLLAVRLAICPCSLHLRIAEVRSAGGADEVRATGNEGKIRGRRSA